METILITIILLLIGVSNLLIITVLGLLLIKYINGSKTKCDEFQNKLTQAPVPNNNEDFIKQSQKAYKEQLMALNDLMNYNADVAYGIKPKEE